MARPSLDDIMNGLATYGGREILADSDDTILAVDTYGSWGAAFELAVSADGSCVAEGMKASRSRDGRWHDLGAGGSTRDGWRTPWTPWTPPHAGWDGRHLGVLGTTGQTVFDDEDRELELLAVYGFVTPHVRSIRVEHDGELRTCDTRGVGRVRRRRRRVGSRHADRAR